MGLAQNRCAVQLESREREGLVQRVWKMALLQLRLLLRLLRQCLLSLPSPVALLQPRVLLRLLRRVLSRDLLCFLQGVAFPREA